MFGQLVILIAKHFESVHVISIPLIAIEITNALFIKSVSEAYVIFPVN